ncbi:MAG: hypothetical protein HC896_14855 [Bacteroidales bacterium]|nr:hypothetical protein [Bacteroidales bacterium]
MWPFVIINQNINYYEDKGFYGFPQANINSGQQLYARRIDVPKRRIPQWQKKKEYGKKGHGTTIFVVAGEPAPKSQNGKRD